MDFWKPVTAAGFSAANFAVVTHMPMATSSVKNWTPGEPRFFRPEEVHEEVNGSTVNAACVLPLFNVSIAAPNGRVT